MSHDSNCFEDLSPGSPCEFFSKLDNSISSWQRYFFARETSIHANLSSFDMKFTGTVPRLRIDFSLCLERINCVVLILNAQDDTRADTRLKSARFRCDFDHFEGPTSIKNDEFRKWARSIDYEEQTYHEANRVHWSAFATIIIYLLVTLVCGAQDGYTFAFP